MRRKFDEAQKTSPAQATKALAFIRTLYAVEREIAEKKLKGDDVVRLRRSGPTDEPAKYTAAIATIFAGPRVRSFGVAPYTFFLRSEMAMASWRGRSSAKSRHIRRSRRDNS